MHQEKPAPKSASIFNKHAPKKMTEGVNNYYLSASSVPTPSI